MKKSYLRLLFQLPLAVVLSACSSDLATEQQNPIFGMTGDDEPVPVEFSVSAQHTGDFTRAASSILTFTSGEAVKVCVSTDDGSSYTGYDFTAAATGQNVSLNAPAGDKPYFPAGSTSSVKAYAYYPSSDVSSWSDDGGTMVFTVADNQTANTDYKRSDLMYCDVQTITKPTTSATLSMAHKMVQLNITASAQDGSGLVVKRVLVNGKKSVTFTPATGATSTTGSNGDIIAYQNGTGAATTGAQYILIPVQQISNVSIKVETGDEDVAATTATFAFTSTDDFEAGNSYPISLTVGTSQLGGTTTIANWNGQQSVTYAPTGDLTIEPISPVTFKDAAYIAADMSTLVVVKKNSTTLTYDTDYTLELLNSSNAGTAVVVALGKAGSSYEGSVAVATFIINKADITPTVTMADWTYGGTASTPSVTGNTGSGAVTYEYKVSTATDDTYSATKPSNAGTYTVKATVDETDNYNSGTTTADFTIVQAAGILSYATVSVTKQTTADPFTNVLTHTGDGTVDYARSAGDNICTVNTSTGEVTLNGSTGSCTITATVTDGANYSYASTTASYTLTVSVHDIKENPLWYVAPRNMSSTATTMESSENAGYFYQWSGAMYKFAAQTTSYTDYKTGGKTITSQSGTWHLPVQAEWWSIVPSGVTNIWYFDSGSGTYKATTPTDQTVIFGYNSTTKAGISDASYWKKISSKEIHAIRFLGTPYCSAWKYELLGGWSGGNYGYLRVSATLIDQVENSESAASSWYTSSWSGVTFGDNESAFAVQRTFYARGYCDGGGATASNFAGLGGYCWSATQKDSGSAWYLNINGSGVNVGVNDDLTTVGRSVRLFRDN